MSLFDSVITKIVSFNPLQPRQLDERQLIHREAEIGGQLFGEIPQGHDRQFFCLDRHTWVWHEEWLDEKGKRQSITTRYEIRPEGILKAQDGQPYRYTDPAETKNIVEAARAYYQLVAKHIYNKQPRAL